MADAVKSASSRDRKQQVHFWSNYNMLAAHTDEIELSEEADQRCREIAIPAIDLFSLESTRSAGALRLIARKQYSEALSELTEGSQARAGSKWRLCKVYCQEVSAVAYSGLGDMVAARRAWSSAVAARADGKGALNPRLKALERRVMLQA
jgi:hypothetical protein